MARLDNEGVKEIRARKKRGNFPKNLIRLLAVHDLPPGDG